MGFGRVPMVGKTATQRDLADYCLRFRLSLVIISRQEIYLN